MSKAARVGRASRELASGVLGVAVSAVLFGLAFPPARLRPFAWLALAPLFVALQRGGTSRALGLVWLWSLLTAYSVGDWLPRSIETYYHQPAIVGWLFFVFVASTMAAPYYAAFALAYRGLARGFSGSLPLWAGVAWAGAELVRGRLFTGTPFFIGNPWALVGYSQVGFAPAVQIASFTGVYGVSFAVAACSGGIAEAWLAWRRGAPARVPRALALGLLPGALLLGHGMFALRDATAAHGGAAVRVAVVQGDVETSSHWRAEYYGRNLDVYLGLTRAVLAREKPELVVWPESALTFFLEREPLYHAAIAAALVGSGAELLVGGPRQEGPEDAPRFFNTVYALDDSGAIRARYEKQHLVPFGEYFPLRSIELLRRRFEAVRTFTPGGEPALLPTPAGPAAIALCNEAMLPEVVGARVALGAELIVNPSNDSWIPETRFAEQQLDIVALRAVEQRRYLVRASTTGPSALVDPWGRVLARTEMGQRAVLGGDVRAIRARSPYGRVGDLFGGACVAAVAGGLALARYRSRESGAGARDATR